MNSIAPHLDTIFSGKTLWFYSGTTEILPVSVTMEIYLFNPETGVYQGEDFADPMPMKPGSHAILSDATAIAPPAFGRGETPVYNAAAKRWEVRRLAARNSERR